MNPEEAIKELKEYYVLLNGKINGNSLLESIEIAISALEKQIPKKIEYVSDGDADGSPVWEDRCQVCEAELDGCNYYSYCPYCGQAIDWCDESGADMRGEE